MKNAVYIAINEDALFNKVINEKQLKRRKRLLSIQARVNVFYKTYLQNFAALDMQKSSGILVSERLKKEALIHCFEHPTSSFKLIRGLIKAGQNDLIKIICPYCLLNEWDTLDHYIPKVSFPEYSILVKNLIPCCSTCNKLKDDNWRKGKQRRIIHFYIDTFLNTRFLYAKIVVNKSTRLPKVKFHLQKPNGLTAYEFSVIKFHFRNLKLLTRYDDLANTIISSVIELIKTYVQSGKSSLADIQTSLYGASKAKALSFSDNYYEAVVLDAFAKDTNYLNSLLTP